MQDRNRKFFRSEVRQNISVKGIARERSQKPL